MRTDRILLVLGCGWEAGASEAMIATRSVISNTTARKIDAHNKLAGILIVLHILFVAPFPFCWNPVVSNPAGPVVGAQTVGERRMPMCSA